MDVGGLGDAACCDDATEDGGDELPLLEKVPAQDDLLGVVLVIADGGRISGGIAAGNIPRGLGWGGCGGIKYRSSGGGGGFLHRRSSGVVA